MLWDVVADWYEDSGLEKLEAVADADELCRELLAHSYGWGSSTSHTEAVELLDRVHGTGDLPSAFVGLMLCTCSRWDRVTTRLIAAVEESGLLSDADLDELSESFLSHEHVVVYPLAWVSPEWLDIDIGDDAGVTIGTVEEGTTAQHRLSFEPPLRRWGAGRALRADPARLDDLLVAAQGFEPRHRDALIHGLLDAADVLEESHRRRLVKLGLRTGRASVRRTALDRLNELDGPEKALRRARSDPAAKVREWRPKREELPQAA